jgi:hypothetical protein
LGNHWLYPEADGFQRPLRFRFQQRLTPGVDMTSDVKSREQLFYVSILFSLSHWKSRSQ